MRYWEERAKEWSAARDKKEHAINAALMDAYQNAADDLQKEIAAWYEKYASEAGISLADAKKRLTARERRELTRSVAAFRKLAKANKDHSQDEILTKMSAAVHINRLTSLQFQMRYILYELYAGTNDAFNNSLWGFYTDERERMTYEVQLARGEFEPVAMIDEKRISAVLKTPWAADGKNFSQRLWTSREQLIGTLQAELTRALITGADSKSVAKTIAQKMNAAEYAASRLVQTETTRIITESDKDTFAEMDIDEVEIVGTLDGHTCDTCGDMDGNHMPRSEAHAGTTAPPFHPNCRCVIVPYYGDEFRDEYRIMRDPETGKSKIVENMTFKEWKERYGDGNAPKNVASKATQNVANSGTISVQRPAGEQDILKKFSYIGNQKTAAERLAAVNPHYDEGFEWENNCQRCVVAEELQARGYNVTAKPFANDGIGGDGTACWNIDWANLQNDAGFAWAPQRSQFKSIVQKAFSTWGGNARAVVRVEWTAIAGSREGHFFSVHMENGQIIYTDPQINEIRDIDETLKDCTPSPYRMWVMRVDNRELTDLVEEAVENI